MQLVQSNDRANRLSFKGALAHKVEAALSAPEPESEVQEHILLIPHNFDSLSETDLHFTLMHNKELKHSRQSANLAVEILFGKTPHPANVVLKSLKLDNPVALPKFEKKTVKRTPARQLTAPDSTAIRMQAEKDKETAFKAYIDTLPKRVETQDLKNGNLTLRVPKNYNDFSEAELFHVLMNTTELEHSRTTAYLAMDILSGKVAKPSTVTLQSISLPKLVPTTLAPVKVKEVIPTHVINAERDKREQFKARLADKAAVTPGIIDPYVGTPDTILLRLPTHFKDLSEAGLFYSLTHNPELQHSHETATLAVNIIFKKMPQPETVQFQTINIVAPEAKDTARTLPGPDPLDGFIPERELEKRAGIKAYLAGQTERILANAGQVAETKETILRLPKNYKELSQDELLYVLTRSPELKHSMDSAYLTLDLMSGKVALSSNVKFHAVEIKPIVEIETFTPVVKTERKTNSLHPEVKAADVPKRQLFKEELADRARAAFNAKPIMEDKALKVILLPEGYESMTPGELHFALVRNPELHHSQESARYAVDILDGKIKNALVQFSVVILENPQLAPATLPKAIKPKAFNTEKKSAIIINRPTLLARAQIPFGEGERVLKIPHNYEEMNETQLHFALSHNREYGHSFESTYETLDILYGRTQCPEGTVFSAIEVDKPIERAY